MNAIPTLPGRRRATLLPIAAVAVPLVMLGVTGWLGWRATFQAASEELSRSAEAGAEYGARALQGYALAAARLNERLRGLTDAAIRTDEAQLHQELRSFVEQTPQAELSYVLDRAGIPLVATSVFPVPRASLADRDYFLAHASPAPGQVLLPGEAFISAQFLGRFDGKLFFTVALARRNSGNFPPGAEAFDGVVSLSVDPNLLAEGLLRFAAQGDMLALVREDGSILSRSSGQDSILLPVPAGSPFHELAGARGRTAVYSGVNLVNGMPNLAAAHRVAGFPVYAVSLRPRAAVVAAWRSQMASHLVFGVPATLALFLLAMRVRRDQLRLSESNANLARDVERGEDRLTRAARVGLVGTFEIDLETGVSLRSPEYMAVHGLNPVPAVEAHTDWLKRLHPDDRARAEAYLLDALGPASDVVDYAQSYRIVTPAGEVRWIAARGEIERGPDGRAQVLRGAHVDVTPLRATQVALAESDARLRLAQEAVGIGTWEWSRGQRRLAWSAKMIELWGFDPAQGQPSLHQATARLHPADRRRVRAEITQAGQTGRLRTEFRIIRPRTQDSGTDGAPETVWIILRAQLIDTAGEGGRLVGVGYDVTERKQAEEQTTLLAHEVEHRAKNILTVVAGLVRLTDAETHEEYVQTLVGRIEALGRTLTLLGQGRWRGTTLLELLQHEFTPFVTESPARIHMVGPEILVDAETAQPLSMALHELTTNAAKYGALSQAGGRLDVAWHIDEGDVHLIWNESGGPRITSEPDMTGFGSQLIAHSFAHKLGGSITTKWRQSGLVCHIRFPLAAE